MIEEFLSTAAASVAVAAFANIMTSYLKDNLAKRKDRREVELRDEEHHVIANLPLSDDLASAEKRIMELQKISARLAVLDGWQIASSTILKNLNELHLSDAAKSQDVISIARQIPGISEEAIHNISMLKKARNLVAHSATSPESEKEILEASNNIISLLHSIKPKKNT
ncbi:hypothetical protein [Acidovorax sp. M2(2025)]|uniref:hypothetical protein n=1 Tax=Acidovorax sp. M2(2025) TaxID=3411355 RepID=UPI003BF56A32